MNTNRTNLALPPLPPDHLRPKKPSVLPLMWGGRLEVAFTALKCCLRGNHFTVATVFEEHGLSAWGYTAWDELEKACGDGEGGLALWTHGGKFLPCRENAVIAFLTFPDAIRKYIPEMLGFASENNLVAAINALPGGEEICPIPPLPPVTPPVGFSLAPFIRRPVPSAPDGTQEPKEGRPNE